MASWKHHSPHTDERNSKRPKLSPTAPDSQLSHAKPRRVELNPADCNLDFNVEGSGLQGQALHESGFAYCWSGARANVGITSGKYCFGCKIISEQPVDMEDTPLEQQHVCRVGISRGDDNVGNLGESEHSFGFGGTGKFSNSGKFLDYGTKFGVGDTIVCAVNLENKPFAVIGFSKNGKWLGAAKEFDAGPRGLGVVNSSVRKLPWESALFPHVLLKNVVIQVQFSIEDGLIPEEGYKPWSSALEDGNAIMGPTFTNPRDCEVQMMVGLPASGKTTWAEKWVKEHPEKRYILLGTNLALDQMKVPGLARKHNYGERFDRLMDRATGIFNTLLARAAKLPRNYILDQTNVYKSARKRKLKAFVNYHKIAVVIFPRPDELKYRAEKRFKEMGKEVPAEAVNEMLANYVLPMSKDMPGADEFFDQVMFPELNREESQRCLDEMKHALRISNSSTKSDFSPYSHESSIESFTTPLLQNAGSVSASGGHWRNSHPPVTPPDYDFHSPQKVTPVFSGSGVGLYGKPKFSPGGYGSGSSDPNLTIPRNSPYGNYPNYGRSLPKNEPDPYGSYGGYDPYDGHNYETRNPVPGGGTDIYRGYGGNDPYRRPSIESRNSTPIGGMDPHRSYGGNDPSSRPSFESRNSTPSGGIGNDRYGLLYPEGPGSFGRLDFESSRSSIPYGSPGAQMGDLRMHGASLRAPMMPHLDPRNPFPAAYGSPHGIPPPRPSSGNIPSAEQWHSDGYPPSGPRYY